MEWMDVVKGTSFWRILKALPLEDGPDTTRAVVLTVNASVCVGLIACFATLCTVCLRVNAQNSLGVIGALVGVITAVTAPLLGFAMSMQKARDALRTDAVVKRVDADGASSVASLSTGGQ